MKYQSSIQENNTLHKLYVDKNLIFSYNINSDLTKEKLWIEHRNGV